MSKNESHNIYTHTFILTMRAIASRCWSLSCSVGACVTIHVGLGLCLALLWRMAAMCDVVGPTGTWRERVINMELDPIGTHFVAALGLRANEAAHAASECSAGNGLQPFAVISLHSDANESLGITRSQLAQARAIAAAGQPIGLYRLQIQNTSCLEVNTFGALVTMNHSAQQTYAFMLSIQSATDWFRRRVLSQVYFNLCERCVCEHTICHKDVLQTCARNNIKLCHNCSDAVAELMTGAGLLLPFSNCADGLSETDYAIVAHFSKRVRSYTSVCKAAVSLQFLCGLCWLTFCILRAHFRAVARVLAVCLVQFVFALFVWRALMASGAGFMVHLGSMGLLDSY